MPCRKRAFSSDPSAASSCRTWEVPAGCSSPARDHGTLLARGHSTAYPPCPATRPLPMSRCPPSYAPAHPPSGTHRAASSHGRSAGPAAPPSRTPHPPQRLPCRARPVARLRTRRPCRDARPAAPAAPRARTAAAPAQSRPPSRPPHPPQRPPCCASSPPAVPLLSMSRALPNRHRWTRCGWDNYDKGISVISHLILCVLFF